MTTKLSIIGFKDPRADLHKQSPKILIGSMIVTALFISIGLNTPLNKNEEFIKKVNKPPVIIELEDIPETRQRVTAPAPRFAMPLEVSDDVMLDDVTIQDTSLDVNTAEPAEVKPVIMEEEVIVDEEPVEEIFEFFAVEEQPQRISEVAPEYPRAAQEARVQGTVFVRALVGTDGSIEAAEVLKGPELLHEAAINAALATKFTPAKQNDMPVKCWVQMRFNFELEG